MFWLVNTPAYTESLSGQSAVLAGDSVVFSAGRQARVGQALVNCHKPNNPATGLSICQVKYKSGMLKVHVSMQVQSCYRLSG
jgi:hypothetical protein